MIERTRRFVGIAAIVAVALSVGALYERTVVLQDYRIEVNDTISLQDLTPRQLIDDDALACEWGDSSLGIFSSNVFSPLIYYSHLFPVFTMCILAFMMWRQGRRNPMAQVFIAIATAFTVWCFFDLATWAEDNPDLIMFFWGSEIYLDPLIYVGATYLFYIFAYEHDLPRRLKAVVAGLLAPVLVLAPTSLNLAGFDYTNCDREAIEGPLWHYVYGLELLFCVWMLIFAMRAIRGASDPSRRRQISLLAAGLGFFMLAFSWGNIVGTITENWVVAQYGLFGMPIFLAVVMYLIIQYQAFEIRAIATSALVMSIGIVLASVLLLPTMESARPVILITLGLFAIMGYLLVQSVRKEIRLRETIQAQEKRLEAANAQQVTLLHFISHEVKGSLNKAQGVFAGLVEGDYGQLPEDVRSISRAALGEVGKGITMVMDLLAASDLKKGTMSFEKKEFDCTAAVRQAVDNARLMAKDKGLAVEFVSPPTETIRITGDEQKLMRHVFRNLLENAIRYTPQGSVRASLVRMGDAVRFRVEDTGVGITPEDMQKLFTEGGHGKDSIKVNVDSTGFGLFIAKQVVEAHRGRIWAESDGAGKGSRFIVELPA